MPRKIRVRKKKLKNNVTRNYNDKEYRELRAAVRKRDGYKCQFPNCNCKNRRQLEVHHLLRWQDYPALRYDPKNCILLCRQHHKFITGKEMVYLKVLLMIVQSKYRGKE